MGYTAAIVVRGVPAPQSRVHSRVVVPPGPGRRAITRQYYPDLKGRMKRWKARIVAASMACGVKPREPLAGPIIFFAEFYLPRPKRLLRKKDFAGMIAHTGKPDLSNLIKLAEDTLEAEGWYVDDKQIFSLGGSGKWWVAKGQEPGCIIRVTEVDPNVGPTLFDQEGEGDA